MAFAISVDIKLIDNITGQLRRVGRAFDGAARQAKRAAQAFKSAGQAMTRIGRNLTLFVSAPIIALGVSSVVAAAKMQRMEISLASLMGSAAGAREEMVKLIEVARLPGLGIAEVVEASVKFQAAGLDADKARASILALGNAVALAGGGKLEFNRASLQLTQIRNKTSGFGLDLKALTESLPLLGNILEEAFGTRATDQISELGFTGEQVFKKMIDAMAGLPKVGDSLANSIENLGDAFQLFKIRIGDSINELFNLEENINRLGDFLRDLAERFDKLDPGVKKFIVFAAIAAAAIGPIIIGLGLLLGSVGSIIFGLIGLKIAFAFILPFLPIIALFTSLFVALGAAVIENLPFFQELFVNLFKRFKEIAIPALKLMKSLFTDLAPIIVFIGRMIAFSLLGLLGLSLLVVDKLLVGFIAISEGILTIRRSLGFNTETLERQLDLVREIQQGFEGAVGDVRQAIQSNQLFNPTNNITNEINIDLMQDEKGIRVAAVKSSQPSTVKTFNTGIMTPIFQ